MKNDPLTGTLVGVLAVSALASILIFYFYVGKSREMRQNTMQLQMIGNRRQAINALIADVMEYRKTHPAIDPVLEQAGLIPKPGAPAAGAPVKPAAK